ncbi:hypothetical protein PVAG01_00699 [Phlyctema vagabunda]|uniref:Peptidyl-tRNA hydrolase n=1 Tax=Phlyctema vagabunda TaxID=108571 RepID=A0ABR4PVC7_9HELO
MRFSTTTILALPLLAAATQQESPLDQAKAQFEYYLQKVQSYLPALPNPNRQHPAEAAHAAASSVGAKTLNVLTLNNWEDTIRSSVKPASTTPEEWYVLVTGGNKTCFGQCGKVETAFNESALLFAADPTAPHLGYLSCENQPVLCNAWGAGPPSLWVIEATAAPAPVDIRIVNLNSSTTTASTFTELHSTKSWKSKPLNDGYFHPFDGPLAQYKAAVPFGYIIWIFSVVPSYVFMIAISFFSRTFMGNRMAPPANRRAGAPAAGAAPAAAAGRRVGAPPGDGVRY